MKRITFFIILFSCIFICNAYNADLDFNLSTDVVNNEICYGSQVIISGLITGGFEPYKVSYNINNVNYTATVDDNEFDIAAYITNTKYVYVTVEDAAKNKHYDSIQVKVINKSLSVNYTYLPNNPCSGTQVSFTPQVANHTGTLSYSWQIDNIEFSDKETGKHRFEAYGCGGTKNFEVKVEVNDGNKCSGATTRQVQVSRQPQLTFTDTKNPYNPFSNCINNPSNSNPNFTITLTNSTLDETCITSYDVDWGDGNTTSNASFPITYTYTALGAFDLVVTGNSITGCNGTFSTVVKNQSNPAVGVTNLGNSQGCEPILYKFLLQGYRNNSPQTSYLIDYGDGTQEQWEYEKPFSDDTIRHTYKRTSCLTAGNQFTVTVTAVNTCESTSGAVSGIKVWDNPKAAIQLNDLSQNISSDTVCVNEEIDLTNRSIAGNYGPSCTEHTEFAWVIPGYDTIKNNIKYDKQTVTFNSEGTYVIELWATNPCGSSKDEAQIVVIEPPVANATASPLVGCSPFVVKTNNLSTGKYLKYEWTVSPSTNYSFVNGTNRYSENPEIEFNKTGNYTITLTTYNSCNTSTKQFAVNVTKAPVIEINSIDDYCMNAQINPTFENNGGNIGNFSWTFNGSSSPSSNVENPINITYNTPGEYYVKLITSNGCGTSTDSVAFNILNKPTLSVSDYTICDLQNVVNIDAVVQHETAFTWSRITGTGTITDASAYSTEYHLSNNDYNNDQILLRGTAQGPSVCGNTIDTTIINIKKSPIITTGPDITVCKTATNFTIDASNANHYKTLKWTSKGTGSFDDDTQVKPVYTPDIADLSNGQVKLILTATSNSPCTQTVKDTLNVTFNNPPQVNIKEDTTLCSTELQISNSQVINSSSFVWSHNGSGIFYSTKYDLNPLYKVSEADATRGYVDLTLTADVVGCDPATDIMRVTLPPLPYLNLISEDFLCEDGIYKFNTGAKNFASIVLSTNGDGVFNNTSVATTNYTPGPNDISNKNVKLFTTITGNVPCETTLNDSLKLNIVHQPNISTLNDQLVGENESLVIDFAIVNNYKFLKWETDGTGSFDNTNQLVTGYTPSEADKANEKVKIWLKAYSHSPCDITLPFVSDTFLVEIVPKPIVNAGDDYSICEGSRFDMPINHASAKRYSEIHWGTTGTGTLTNKNSFNPSYQPSVQDIENRKVTLYINAKGEAPIEHVVATDSMVLTIVHNAHIDLVPSDTFCENAIYIPGNYTEQDVSTYQWSSSSLNGYFNDNTLANPGFTPDAIDIQAGIVSLFVEARSYAPCTATDKDTLVLEIWHVPNPVFDFEPKTGCGPLKVNFTNSSEGEQLNYEWQFGDFHESTLMVPDSINFNPGIIADTAYNIVLTATNQCSVEQLVKTITVQSSPTSRFAKTPSWGCSPLTILFQNNSLGLPTEYTWDWGDNSANSNLPEPTEHVFTTGDTNSDYTITLIAKNQCGIDTLKQTIKVFPNTVEAFFNADTTIGCAPLEISFTNTSRGSIGNTPFLEWSWNFGDGNISDKKNPVHLYKNPGTYKVSLYVHDSCAYDTMSTLINVLGAQKVDFLSTKNMACVGDSIEFIPLNLDYSKVGDITWDFGDSTISNDTRPFHQFDSSSTYNVQLIASHIETGCEATTTKKIEIQPNPNTNFVPSTTVGCQPLPLSFVNNTEGATYYLWNYGDGGSSVNFAPEYVYDSAGNFEIVLQAENEYGCTDTALKMIKVNPKPYSSFAVSDSQSCFYPVSINLTNTSDEYDANTWYINNNKITEDKHTQQSFDNTGTYNIQLIAYNKYNCTDTSNFIFTVYDNPVAQFKVANKVGCDPLTVQFNNTTEYGNTYIWHFDESDTSQQENPRYEFIGPGLYTVGLEAIGDGGCYDSIVKPYYILVHPSPEANFDFIRVNEADTVQFFDISYGATGRTWFFGDGDTSGIQGPLHRYDSFGVYNASIVSVNEFNCTDTLTKKVDVGFYKGLYLPNALSPDNLSESVQFFTPAGTGLATIHVVIYDLWGNKLWETRALENNRPSESWNGTDLNGNMLPADTYFWHIKEATFIDGSSYNGKKYGMVYLIR